MSPSPNGAGPPDSLSAPRPCPFCGDEDIITGWRFCKCDNCGAVVEASTKEQAIAAWNRRVAPAGPEGLGVPQDTKSNPSNGLVERLREARNNRAAFVLQGPAYILKLCGEAADEIEKLREVLKPFAEWFAASEQGLTSRVRYEDFRRASAALYQQEGVLSSQRGENRSANASLLREELTNVLEWAETERAPLRDAEIGSIRKVLGLAPATPRATAREGTPDTESAETLAERSAANNVRWLSRIAKIEAATKDFKVAPGADTWDAWCEACPPTEILWLAGFARVVIGQCEVAREREGESIAQRDHYSREWDKALNASPATPIGGLSVGDEGDQGASRAMSGRTAQAPKSDSDGGH